MLACWPQEGWPQEPVLSPQVFFFPKNFHIFILHIPSEFFGFVPSGRFYFQKFHISISYPLWVLWFYPLRSFFFIKFLFSTQYEAGGPQKGHLSLLRAPFVYHRGIFFKIEKKNGGEGIKTHFSTVIQIKNDSCLSNHCGENRFYPQKMNLFTLIRLNIFRSPLRSSG